LGLPRGLNRDDHRADWLILGNGADYRQFNAEGQSARRVRPDQSGDVYVKTLTASTSARVAASAPFVTPMTVLGV
jgi:hypothetical protein